MKNKIIATLIISLILSQANFAIVINNEEYQRIQNEQYTTKVEAYEYFNNLQNWLDKESKVELLRKVASRSELHGYYSENEIDWEHLYDERDTKATRSITR